MWRSRAGRIVIGALVAFDAATLSAVLILSNDIANRFGAWKDPLSYGWLAEHPWGLALTIPLWLAIFWLSQLYQRRYLLTGPQEYAKVFSACTTGVMVLAVGSILLPGPSTLSAVWILNAWLFAIGFVTAVRFLFRRIVWWFQKRGHFVSRALIVGVNEQSKAMARVFQSPHTGVRVVGFLDEDLPPGTLVINSTPVLGSPRHVGRVIEEMHADQVIVVREALAWENFQEILEETSIHQDGLDVKMLQGFQEILTTGVEVQHTGFLPLLALERVRIRGFDAFLKNLLDAAVAVVLLVILSPLLLLVALILPFLGPGSILAREYVLGRTGEPFNRLTFNLRQRPVDQPEWRGVAARIIQASRITMAPQLFNVLRGQLSLVGPRPIPVGQEAVVRRWLPNLLAVKPGMTGPWAVAAAARDSLETEMRATMFYVRNYSIWLDLAILSHAIRRGIQQHKQLPAATDVGPVFPELTAQLHQLAQRLTTDLPISGCYVSVVDPKRRVLCVVAAHTAGHNGEVEDSIVVPPVPLTEAPLHQLATEQGHTLCFQRSHHDVGSRWSELPIASLEHMRAGALLPLNDLGPLRAAALLTTDEVGDVFSGATLRRARTLIADHLGAQLPEHNGYSVEQMMPAPQHPH